jgi:hypothetical protein
MIFLVLIDYLAVTSKSLFGMILNMFIEIHFGHHNLIKNLGSILLLNSSWGGIKHFCQDACVCVCAVEEYQGASPGKYEM